MNVFRLIHPMEKTKCRCEASEASELNWPVMLKDSNCFKAHINDILIIERQEIFTYEIKKVTDSKKNPIPNYRYLIYIPSYMQIWIKELKKCHH